MPDSSSASRPHGTPPGGDAPSREDASRRLAACRPLRDHVDTCLAEIEAAMGTSAAGGAVKHVLDRLRAVRSCLADAVVSRETDLGLGRRLMTALVPGAMPEVRGLGVAVRVEPSAAVGGNVCLLLPVTPGHLVIAVLDASGQGLAVACVSVWAALELARCAFTGSHAPRALLDRLNRRLLDRPEGRYLRAFAADLDLDLMEMAYVNASHCEPLWLRGQRVESVDTQGLFVGLFEDAEYEEKSLQLSEGEGLLFYSDAVVDALRFRAGLVESAGLQSLVEEHRRDNAERLVEVIAAEIWPETLVNPDDVVILALQCRRVEEWHTMVIPSRFDEAKRIADAILEHLTRSRFAERSIFATKLALDEALTNAIKHGNKGDPKKRVRVRYTVCPDRVVLIVGDEGEGFDPSGIPDPTNDERLELPAGRGILLMRAYMTEVEFQGGGRQVKLTRLNE